MQRNFGLWVVAISLTPQPRSTCSGTTSMTIFEFPNLHLNPLLVGFNRFYRVSTRLLKILKCFDPLKHSFHDPDSHRVQRIQIGHAKGLCNDLLLSRPAGSRQAFSLTCWKCDIFPSPGQQENTQKP